MLVKTEQGLEIEVNENAFNDMEALDALVEMDEGNPLAMSKVCNILFKKHEKKKLYDFYRNKQTGRVELETFIPVITDIMTKLNTSGKN